MVDFHLIINTVMITVFSEAVIAFFCRKSIKNALSDWLRGEISTYIDDIASKPEVISKIMVPFLKVLLAELKIEPTKGNDGSMKIMGFKVPSFIVEAIAKRFLGSAEQAVTESNPFG